MSIDGDQLHGDAQMLCRNHVESRTCSTLVTTVPHSYRMTRGFRSTSSCTSGESPIALKLCISPALTTKILPRPPSKVRSLTVHIL